MKIRYLVLALFIFVAFFSILITHQKRNYSLQKFERLIKKTYRYHLYEDRKMQQSSLRELQQFKEKLEIQDTVRHHLAYARYYKLVQNFPQALIHIEKAEKLIPRSPSSTKEQSLSWEIPLLHGIILYQLKLHPDALAKLKDAHTKNPESKHAALYLSQTHFALAPDDSSDSLRHLSEALKYANLALKLSKLTQAEKPNQPIDSNWAPAWNQRAVVLMRRQDYLSARLDLIEAIRLEPEYPRAHYNLSLCAALLSIRYLSSSNQNDQKIGTYRSEAIRHWQELQKLAPNLARDLYVKAGIQTLVEGVSLD